MPVFQFWSNVHAGFASIQTESANTGYDCTLTQNFGVILKFWQQQLLRLQITHNFCSPENLWQFTGHSGLLSLEAKNLSAVDENRSIMS